MGLACRRVARADDGADDEGETADREQGGGAVQTLALA
jgi:hypothetical protein